MGTKGGGYIRQFWTSVLAGLRQRAGAEPTVYLSAYTTFTVFTQMHMWAKSLKNVIAINYSQTCDR